LNSGAGEGMEEAIKENTPNKRPSEDERILSVQLELLPSADVDDIKKALHMLKQFPELVIVVDDYKKYEEELKAAIYEGEIARKLNDDELYSNKPANSVILAQNQKAAAEECELTMKTIERAVGLIRDQEAREAVYLRYLKGHSYKETALFMKRGFKSATLDRRLKAGIVTVANTLKMWGVLDWKK
jgi:hypothetical protein